MITVIGCGNPARKDDGVGVWVAQQLQAEFSNDNEVSVLDAGTSGLEVMFHARGSDALIIIDASSTDAEPGVIFDVPGNELENAAHPPAGAHGFRWDHALYAGQRIFAEEFPKKVSVFLVEAEALEFGLELSPIVAEAADKVLQLVRERINQYRQLSIRVANGNLYIDRGVHDQYFSATASVALVRQEQQLSMFPLNKIENGGLLIKQRNAEGDRVIHAQAFFRDNELNDQEEQQLQAVWNIDQTVLVMNIERLVV